MRKFVILGVVGGVLSWGIPATAEVDVFADINKRKLIDVVENIRIVKDIDINARVVSRAIKAAEAHTVVNQENFRNQTRTLRDYKTDSMIFSVIGNEGVVNVNEAAGNMNNQGNATSVAIDAITLEPPTGTRTTSSGFADAQSAIDQETGAIQEVVTNGTTGSAVTSLSPQPNFVNEADIWFRSASIFGSINNNTGIVGVSQATGNMNNQTNAVAMAVAFSNAGVALSEADLGQVSAFNTVQESRAFGSFIGVTKRASLTRSVNNNAGIVGTNQTVGNMGNQANNVSLAWVQGVTPQPAGGDMPLVDLGAFPEDRFLKL